MNALSKISLIVVGLGVDVILFMFCFIILASALHFWKGIEVEQENKRSNRIFWLSFVIIGTIMIIISLTIETPGEHLCKFLISIKN